MARKIQLIITVDDRDVVEAERSARRLGQAVTDVGNSESLTSMFLKADLVGRGIAFITSKVQELGSAIKDRALELDAYNKKFTALEGGSDQANRRILQLQQLSRDSVGVLQKGAFEAYTLFKGIGTVGEASIERITKSVGRLNAVFSIDDQQGFFRNLTQIYKQGFEIADIKEALTRVPIFDQLLKQAFGTDDPEKLRELKNAGKLTMDTYISGLAEAIDTDPRFANVTDNLATKIAKSWERITTSLAPAAEKVLTGAIEPALNKASGIVDFLSSVSPATTTTVLALVAALGLLVAAYNAVSIAAGISGTVQALTAFISGMGGTIFVIQNVIRAMIGLQTAFITTAEVAVAATGGWAAVAIAVGAVLYAIYQYNAEARKTAEEHQKGIDLVQEQVDGLRRQQESLNSVQSNTTELASKQRDLADVYATLNDVSKARVDIATEEKGATIALREEIERLKNAQVDQLTAKLVGLANDTAAAFRQKEEAERARAAADQAYRDALRTQMITRESFSGETGTTTYQIPATAAEINKLRLAWENAEAAARTANETFDNNRAVLAAGAQIRGWTIEQIINYSSSTNQAVGYTDAFKQTLFGAANGQNVFLQSVQNTNQGIQEQTGAVKDLRTELQKLTAQTGADIQKKISDVVTGAAGDATEAAKKAKEMMTTDQNLIDLLKKNKDFKEATEKVEKVWGLSADRGGGGQTKIDRAKKQLSELKQQIESAMGNPQVRAFFAALSTIEGGGRFTVVGGAKANPLDPRHPGQYGMGMEGPAGWSTAAGLWQITRTNWERLQKTLNLTDFRDVNQQLKVALYLFQEAAGKKGINGIAQLLAGNLEKAARLGTQPWAASPFSTLPGGKRRDFLSVIEKNLGGGVDLGIVSDEVRILQEIAETRERINQLITQGGDANQNALDNLREQESTLKSIVANIEKIRDMGLTREFTLPKTAEEAKAMKTETDQLISTVENLRSQFDGARAKIFELGAGFDNGMTNVQKFDLELKILRETGKLTAEDFDALAVHIWGVRRALQRLDEAEAAKKLRLEAKAALEAVKNLTEGFKSQFVDLTTGKTPLNDFLRSIESIKELKIPAGGLDKFKELFAAGDQVDVEKFAQVVRQWLILRSIVGDFDKTKIEEVVNAIKAAAQGFNSVSDAQRNADFAAFSKDLQQQFEEVRRGNRELTVYEETWRRLATDYKNLDPQQKQNLLNLAAEIDAVKELNRQHAELKDFFQETLTYAFEGDITGLFKNWADRIREGFIDKLSGWLATNILGFDPNETNNPVAKPIVGKITETNKILERIAARVGAPSIPGVGGNLGGLGTIFGGGGAGGFGGAGFGGFGGAGFGGSGSYGTRTGDIVDGVMQVFSGDKGRGDWLSNIKRLFSTKDGGIFAARDSVFGGKSKMGGILGGIGDIASMVGGMIGGRLGNIMSMAGSGMSIGAMFGPWGAAIGAGVGALVGLFMGDPKRKIDKKENLPKLQRGFADAFKEFQQLIADVRMGADPDSAMSKGRELRAQIAGGFGIEFQSKKYRKEAQKLIAQKLAEIDREPDGLMAQLKLAVEQAKAAGDRNKRILPEWASGNFFGGRDDQIGEMRRLLDMRRGYIAGGQLGVDRHLGLFADGEVILNQIQQRRMNAMAGFDVFAGAGIPNYPRKSPQIRKFADGAAFGAKPPAFFAPSRDDRPIVLNADFEVKVSEKDVSEVSLRSIQSDDGKRVIFNITNDGKKTGRIK